MPKRFIPAVRKNTARKSAPIIPPAPVAATPDVAPPAPMMPGGMKKGGKASCCMAEGGEAASELQREKNRADVLGSAGKEKMPVGYEDVIKTREAKKAYEGGEKARKASMGSVGFKKGGYVRAADGIAKKGKTKGRMI